MAENDLSFYYLICDVGNSSLKLGIANEREIISVHTLPSDPGTATSDSLGWQILALLQHSGIDIGRVAGCAAASVCPSFNAILRMACKRYIGQEALFVPDDMRVPLDNCYDDPDQLGCDRLLAAWAATCYFPGAPGLVVVDIGTALTVDCVSQGRFEGGLIFPGPHAALQGMIRAAEKLHSIDIDDSGPDFFEPGKNTRDCINRGLLLGYSASIKTFISQMKKFLPAGSITIATGGILNNLTFFNKHFDVVVPELVLDALAMLYIKHKTGFLPVRARAWGFINKETT